MNRTFTFIDLYPELLQDFKQSVCKHEFINKQTIVDMRGGIVISTYNNVCKYCEKEEVVRNFEGTLYKPVRFE